MNNRVLKTLEFDKILNILSQFAVMDITKTEILELKPENNLKKVLKLQDETENSLSLLVKNGNPPIMCNDDIISSLKRADRDGVLTCKELIAISKTLLTCRRFKKYISEQEQNVLYEYIDSLYENKEIENKINSCIIDENTIADDASSELLDIRRKIRVANNKVRDILQKLISSSSKQKYLQEQIITMRSDRYVVPVKAEHKNEIPGIVHDVSSTGATFFIEPASVVEENNLIRKLSVLEKEEIERILKELSNMVGCVSKIIEISFKTIVLLDLIFAKGKFALKFDAFKPEINDKGYINLIKARHPLLDPQTVVPIDIYLGEDFDTLVITGPNTGGKTVALKTVGLLTLMAQAGLHITANEGSKISVFEEVFADIGDEQSIEQSLSTFSSHMVNIVDIIKKANDTSLCLFDELGAGTDPVEGAALAISILEYVKNMGAKSVATTHYSEIKMYGITGNRVENASCEFNVDTLEPTYKLLIGIPGKSNAFAISKRLGLPDYIIDKAKEHIDTENVKFEDVLTELIKNRELAEKEKERALVYKSETEKLKQEMSKKSKALSDKTDKIIEKAYADAKKIVEKAKADADGLIAQIKQAQKEKDLKEANKAAENARRELSKRAKETSAKANEKLTEKTSSKKPLKSVKLGDSVEIISLGQNGTVLTLPDSKGNLMIRVGIIKVKSNLSDLALVKEESSKKSTGYRNVKSLSRVASVSTEIDIRGQNIEDAAFILDKFIDDAVLSSLQTVRIIHGKGTGVLRTGIQDYLKRHPHVKSYRLAGYGEGNSGVTIAELK